MTTLDTLYAARRNAAAALGKHNARSFAVRRLLRMHALQRRADTDQRRNAEIAALQHLVDGRSASTALRLAEADHLPPRPRAAAQPQGSQA